MAGIAVLSAAALCGGMFIFAERRIKPLLRGELPGPGPTRVYSTATRLRPGTPLTPRELEERLARLDYARVTGPPSEPGEFREEPSPAEGVRRYVIRLRKFAHPFAARTPVPAAIDIEAGRVRALRLVDSWTPMLEVSLEPELLSEVTGPEGPRRERLSAADLPESMMDALVAIEDRRFYRHRGVDARAVMRAAWRNVRAGRVAEGGSTLTQQLARSVFLSPKRTMTRKVKEALIALYLELRFPKPEILRLYLENVYFGQKGSTALLGLPAASRHFFNKRPKDLSLTESALLAGLLRSPNRYNPFRYPQRALERRNMVLGAMRREGLITREAERLAMREPVAVSREGHPRAGSADYFLAYVRRVLETRYDDSALMTRGLTIHTTLDPWLQEAALRAVSKSPTQAALVAVDPRTGAIRALVGGRGFAQSPFDRATRARRQPGSAFKPFVFGAALRPRKDGARVWTPAALLSDTTRSFRIEGGAWTPRNYDRTYRGPVALRTALALSLNAASVNLAAEVGPKRIIDYARELGIRSPLRPELGLALGVFEVSLLELTGAYCAFANGGFRVEPHGVDIALDADDGVLEYHSPEPIPALSPGEAYVMTSLLRQVVASGTGRGLERWGLSGVAAGKTGTTDEGRDAWFVGYTPRLAAGVWAGSDKPAKLGLSGAGAALPLWASFFRDSVHPPEEPLPEESPWPRPDEVLRLRIDPASGLLARSGCPRPRTEIFLSGTEPKEECSLHPGGVRSWIKRLLKRWKGEKQSYR